MHAKSTMPFTKIPTGWCLWASFRPPLKLPRQGHPAAYAMLPKRPLDRATAGGRLKADQKNLL